MSKKSLTVTILSALAITVIAVAVVRQPLSLFTKNGGSPGDTVSVSAPYLYSVYDINTQSTTVWLHRGTSQEKVFDLVSSSIISAAVSPDGKKLAVVSESTGITPAGIELFVYDLEAQAKLLVVQTQRPTLYSGLRWLPDSGSFVFADTHEVADPAVSTSPLANTVYQYILNGNGVRKLFGSAALTGEVAGSAAPVAVSPDGQLIYVAVTWAYEPFVQRLYTYNPGTSASTLLIDNSADIAPYGFTDTFQVDTARQLVYYVTDGKLHARSLATETEKTYALPLTSPAPILHVSPDGRWVLYQPESTVATTGPLPATTTITALDLRTSKTYPMTVLYGSRFEYSAWLPSGNQLLLETASGRLLVNPAMKQYEQLPKKEFPVESMYGFIGFTK